VKNIKIKKLEENVGFSKAFNLGLALCNGDFILSLNPDVTLDEHFLDRIVEKITSDQLIGIVTPKLLRANDKQKLDSTGLFLDFLRKPFDRGQGETDTGKYDRKESVFGACGAATLYSKIMVEDLKIDGEFLDEDFFAYYDDADVAWRANIFGWKSVFSSEAIALHIRGWGDTLLKSGKSKKIQNGPRMALRNRYLMMIKNDNLFELLPILPILIIHDFVKVIIMLFLNPGALIGYIDLITLLPAALRKRKAIQKRRQKTNFKLRSFFNQIEFLF
jgi:GT2 family glycosyltransferase